MAAACRAASPASLSSSPCHPRPADLSATSAPTSPLRDPPRAGGAPLRLCGNRRDTEAGRGWSGSLIFGGTHCVPPYPAALPWDPKVEQHPPLEPRPSHSLWDHCWEKGDERNKGRGGLRGAGGLPSGTRRPLRVLGASAAPGVVQRFPFLPRHSTPVLDGEPKLGWQGGHGVEQQGGHGTARWGGHTWHRMAPQHTQVPTRTHRPQNTSAHPQHTYTHMYTPRTDPCAHAWTRVHPYVPAHAGTPPTHTPHTPHTLKTQHPATQ